MTIGAVVPSDQAMTSELATYIPGIETNVNTFDNSGAIQRYINGLIVGGRNNKKVPPGLVFILPGVLTIPQGVTLDGSGYGWTESQPLAITNAANVGILGGTTLCPLNGSSGGGQMVLLNPGVAGTATVAATISNMTIFAGQATNSLVGTGSCPCALSYIGSRGVMENVMLLGGDGTGATLLMQSGSRPNLVNVHVFALSGSAGTQWSLWSNVPDVNAINCRFLGGTKLIRQQSLWSNCHFTGNTLGLPNTIDQGGPCFTGCEFDSVNQFTGGLPNRLIDRNSTQVGPYGTCAPAGVPTVYTGCFFWSNSTTSEAISSVIGETSAVTEAGAVVTGAFVYNGSGITGPFNHFISNPIASTFVNGMTAPADSSGNPSITASTIGGTVTGYFVNCSIGGVPDTTMGGNLPGSSPAANPTTNTSATATVSTQAVVSGTAFAPNNARDVVLYFPVSVGAASVTLTLGPTTGAENTILSAFTAATGSVIPLRVPAGWSVIWTSTATLGTVKKETV